MKRNLKWSPDLFEVTALQNNYVVNELQFAHKLFTIIRVHYSETAMNFRLIISMVKCKHGAQPNTAQLKSVKAGRCRTERYAIYR